MKSVTTFKKINSTTKAAIILALVIVAAYSPMIFLNQSHDYARPIPREFLGYNSSKIPTFNVTIDPGADFEQNWPVMKLATDLYKEGKIPLWNPYMGGGQPLAADTVNYIFSPLMMGFLLPVELWDVPLLVALWIAGFTMFLFVRSLGLNFTASICGGIFYMLSGAFTWYLPHTTVAVMIFTPFILYSLEKIIQNKNPKYIALLSVSILFSILGAHLESIVLQMMIAGLYLVYRIVYLGISRHRTNVKISSENNLHRLTFSTKRILLWSALGFIGGLGLSAFLILPVYEFIENGYLSHNNVGLGHDELHVILPAFVPYILGQVQSYWSQSIYGHAGSWDSLWGYVGMFALFFSIIGVYFSLKNKINNHHRYTPLFFVAISIFFIMKTVGVPVVNWIGYLPVLNMIIFTRYASVIVPLGFAVAGAFGIDLLSTMKIRTKILALICLISISIILLLLIPYLPYLSPDAKFTTGISAVDARNYVGFQILQAVLLAFIAFFLSIAISKNKSAIIGIIPLVLLELFLYIPVGLSPIWMAYKSIVVLAGVVTITLLVLKPNRFAWNIEPKNVKCYVIMGILITTISGGVLISEASPYGMMTRYNSFQDSPVTNFLKENLGTSRMFSFDWSLAPNFPVAYKISTLGIMSAFNIDSFYSFNHKFLDQDAWTSNLGYPSWTQSGGQLNAIDKFISNKKYFDFLGVKYILTEGFDLNSFTFGGPRSATYRQIGPNDNDTGQSFVSPSENISGVGVSFGTYLLQNHGTIILIIDSVPYDAKYHRESILNAENITDAQFNEFKFTPPLTDTLNKQFYLSLKYPQTDAQNKIGIFYYGESTNPTSFNTIKNKLYGKFYENGIIVSGKEMSFSIVKTENFPTALKFHNINIYENINAFPHTFLVNKFHVVNSSKAQDYLLQNPNFDLRNEVILENQLPQEWVNRLESSVAGTSNAEITSYSEDKVTIHTNTKDASLLVLTDTYYPGWKSYVDGKESPIYRADGLVRAVFVPEGSHTVEFSYMPNSFVIGMIISFVTAGILLGIVIYSKKQKNEI